MRRRPDASPVPGARITLLGTTRHATADEQGAYSVVGLAPGEYEVIATRIGYRPAFDTVRVRPGAMARADFSLEAGSVLRPAVVVTASRAAEAARDAAAALSVLPPEVARTSPARAVDDLLREMPGLEMPRTSSTVGRAEQVVGMRGTGAGRTLVLLDGVPLNDPWGEWIQWNRAPRSLVQRVEIVEGGGSSLYGNYAMGGVIQFFSRPLTPRTATAVVSGGSRDAYDLSLFSSDRSRNWGYAFDADLSTGGGYTRLRPDQRGAVDAPSRSSRSTVTGRLERSLGDGRRAHISGAYFSEDRDLGTALTKSSRDLVSGTVGAELGSVYGGQLEANGYGQIQHFRIRQSTVGVPLFGPPVVTDRSIETPAPSQRIPSRDLGGSVIWSRPAGPFDVLTLGGDVRYMAGELDEDVSITNVRRLLEAGGSQFIGGIFVRGVMHPVPALRVDASARMDDWRNFDGVRRSAETLAGFVVSTRDSTIYPARTDAAFSPRLGLRYQLTPSVAIRGSYFRAFRAPTLDEQFRIVASGDEAFEGNPELGAEHLTGGDAGFDWHPVSRVELRATAFANDLHDLAAFALVDTLISFSGHIAPGIVVRGPGGLIFRRQNVGRARSRGAEVELAIRLLDPLRVVANYNYDDARIAGSGERVPGVPLQRAAVRVDITPVRIGELHVVWRYEGPNTTLDGATRLAPFALVDADARRRIMTGVEIFVGVENLLDREYPADFAGPLEYLGMPRTIRAGLAVGDS